MPVRLYQGPLQGLGQEHGAADHAICVEQSVDGAPTTNESAGMSASAIRANASQQLEKATHRGQYAQEMHYKLNRVSRVNSCRLILPAAGVMQTFPSIHAGLRVFASY